MRSFQGKRLKNLRINRGYSLEMTARILGFRSGKTVTRSAICHWERGGAKPSTENLLALGETFQVPIDYFFEPLPNYLFGVVELPHTRRGKPPLPELTMVLEPALRQAGLEGGPSELVGPESPVVLEPAPPGKQGRGRETESASEAAAIPRS